jgi:hypothetical protein
MEYKLLANPRIRQEAQRSLRVYHAAYRRRHASLVSSTDAVKPPRHGACWRFYRGDLPAAPGREHVDDLLAYGGERSAGTRSSNWSPNELECRHDYIQWLFPLRERGVNWLAPLLTSLEAEEMQHDGLVMARVLQALRMMLRFYGTDITYSVRVPSAASSSSSPSAKTPNSVCLEAQLRRTRDLTEWAEQYDNLVHRSHNYLRISRILQFLGEVGLEPLKLGWLEYLAQEVMAGPPAQAPLAACRSSFFFWMEIPYEEKDRARLQRLVEKLASGSTQPMAATGPVVIVKDVLLPSTLDTSRVVGARQPPADVVVAAAATSPSFRENARAGGAKRQRDD